MKLTTGTITAVRGCCFAQVGVLEVWAHFLEITGGIAKGEKLKRKSLSPPQIAVRRKKKKERAQERKGNPEAINTNNGRETMVQGLERRGGQVIAREDGKSCAERG